MSKVPKKITASSSLQKLSTPKQTATRSQPKKPQPATPSPTKTSSPLTSRSTANSSSSLTKSSTVGSLQHSHPPHTTTHQPSTLSSSSSSSSSLHKSTSNSSHTTSTHTPTSLANPSKTSHPAPKQQSTGTPQKTNTLPPSSSSKAASSASNVASTASSHTTTRAETATTNHPTGTTTTRQLQQSPRASPSSSAAPAATPSKQTPSHSPSSSISKQPEAAPSKPVPTPVAKPAAPQPWEIVDGMLTFHQKPKLADFELMQIIGSGTFGIVQVARHRGSGEYVALKILNKQRICDLRQAEHMRYEREVLIRCQHPRIVRLYASMQDEDNIYLVMELCLGGDFFSLRQERETFQPSAVQYYAAQLVTALEHLHNQHIAYRDLKPENILLDSHGQLKLTDFGFAKELTDLTFTLCGTAEYIAPELVLGTGHDMGVDWWATGILLYEMLVGNPPFYGDLNSTYEAIIRYKPPTKGLFDPKPEDTPEEAELRNRAKDLIIELLRKDRRKRLGCLFGGTQDVKNHPFFEGIDWEAIKNGTLTAPCIPPPINPQDLPAIEPEPNEPVDPPEEPGPESDPSNFVDF